MSDITRDEIAALTALEQKATPGPWHAGHFSDPESKCDCRYILSEGNFGGVAEVYVDNGKNISDGGNDAPSAEQAAANQKLIAALRNHAPALLRAAERWEQAQGLLQRYEDARTLRLSEHVALSEKKITRERWTDGNAAYNRAVDEFHVGIAALLAPEEPTND